MRRADFDMIEMYLMQVYCYKDNISIQVLVGTTDKIMLGASSSSPIVLKIHPQNELMYQAAFNQVVPH